MAIGLVWGLCFGDLEASLKLALFFELFWLDLFSAGTYIAPNGVASTVLALALSRMLQLEGPGEQLWAILLCMPFAKPFARLEGYGRSLNNLAYNRLLRGIRAGNPRFEPGKLAVASELKNLVMQIFSFLLVLCCLLLISYICLGFMRPSLSQMEISYGQIWLFASLGALLSLRAKPAYGLLLMGVGLLVLLANLA